jgi:hypothetical protein
MDAAQTLRREPHTMKKSQTKKQDRAVNSLYSTRRAPLDDGMAMLASCFNACDAHIDEHLVVALL